MVAAATVLPKPASAPQTTYLYTETARFEPEAWRDGGERFPQGAQIRIAPTGRRLAPDFFASCDADLSVDGRRVLFAGKRRRDDPWQIWEIAVAGGQPRLVASNGVRPLYLPGGAIAVARKYGESFQIAVVDRDAREVRRLSYGVRGVFPAQVLEDGRILFEGTREEGGELYAVYSDGSGVESVRCRHAGSRQHPRQIASGDIVFAAGTALARITSAFADPKPIAAMGGEIGGAIAELGAGRWLVPLRLPQAKRFALYEWGEKGPAVVRQSPMNVVQPVMVAPRRTPPIHPSGLHDREGANLLCLNAYESPLPLPAGEIKGVRVLSRDDAGREVLLGQSGVEPDGSFYLRVPTERPLKLELTGSNGRRLAGEHGWFWMRRGEQRICVGCHAGPERAPENAVPQVLLRSPQPVSLLPEVK